MRCTNDIKAQIKSSVRDVVDEIKQHYLAEIEKEKTKISEWRKERFLGLQYELQPIIHTWAKKVKKNYSSYLWQDCSSSQELFARIVMKMFNEKGWNDRFPEVSTKKLNELQKKKDEFKVFVEATLNEAFVRVSFVKSMDELNELIESTKEKIKKFYEN